MLEICTSYLRTQNSMESSHMLVHLHAPGHTNIVTDEDLFLRGNFCVVSCRMVRVLFGFDKNGVEGIGVAFVVRCVLAPNAMFLHMILGFLETRVPRCRRTDTPKSINFFKINLGESCPQMSLILFITNPSVKS